MAAAATKQDAAPPGLSPACAEILAHRDFEPGEAPLIVCVDREGRIYVRGSRSAVEAFLLECVRLGLVLELTVLSTCG